MQRARIIALTRFLLGMALILALWSPNSLCAQEPQQINLDGPFLLPPPPPEETGPTGNFAPANAPPPPFQFSPPQQQISPPMPPLNALPINSQGAPPPPATPQTQQPFQFQPDASQYPQPTAAMGVSQPTPLPPPAPEAIAAPAAKSKADAPLLIEEPGGNWWASKVWDPWEGNVELGLNGTDGNSETFNVRLGVTAKHKTDTFVRSVQFTTIQKSANGVTTANTALLDGRLEWPMPGSRWNYFIHGLAEYDEFKAFDARVSGDTGFGYEWIQNDATTFITRTGLSVSNEIGGPDDTVHPELLFGAEFKHKFNATHSISFKSDFYPDVTEFSDFRLNSQASWEIALAQAWGLSLKLSIIDRYDSTPQGARPNDLDYSTLLIWSF
ncbi:DUF481 domain-containing protein [Anatilimnocola floriformis]|uniref:DUF481 domain-containing protein n=1 Tax=Anatilimnocola floriformis TaxID=2948575 RepID=UPI0020C1EE2C|nr:DUF481 domain-containing protein [Anatilimnocola floriformis]